VTIGNVIGIAIGEVENARVQIALDGTVTLGEGVTLDEASLLFWGMIASSVRQIQPYEMQRLRARLKHNCPGAPEMQEPAPHTMGGFARRWVANHGLDGNGEEGFIGAALIELVDCLRSQGHNAASATHLMSAFMELMADYENEDSPEWGQFWMSEPGQSIRQNPPIHRTKADG